MQGLTPLTRWLKHSIEMPRPERLFAAFGGSPLKGAARSLRSLRVVSPGLPPGSARTSRPASLREFEQLRLGW